MSAARVGEWQLLGYESDPVPAAETGLDSIISHYENIAKEMHTQAALLKKLGDGDESLLKGLSADALRKRAGETHKAMGKAADRYDNVHAAIKTYRPELKIARSETREALTAAETAAAEQKTAEGLPDPVNADRAKDAPPLTDEDKRESRSRTGKIEEAKGALAAARSKAEAAMSALDSAAQRAADTIRKNWGDDGLGHSGWEAFVAKISGILKKIVEVLGWIGMALSILAMFIPGLQVLAWAALGVAVLGLAGSIFLAATGGDSWVNVIFGVLGVLAFGAGAIAMKGIKGAAAAGKVVGNEAAGIAGGNLIRMNSRLAQLQRLNTNNSLTRLDFITQRINSIGPKIVQTELSLGKWTSFVQKIPAKSWDILKHPFKNWSATKLLGLDDVTAAKGLAAALKDLSFTGSMGITGSIKWWHYAIGPGNFALGNVTGIFGMVLPESAIFEDTDKRDEWSWWAEYDYLHNFHWNPIVK